MTDEQFKVFIKEVRAIRRAIEAIPSVPADNPYERTFSALSQMPSGYAPARPERW
jgi:hypothetical protein